MKKSIVAMAKRLFANRKRAILILIVLVGVLGVFFWRRQKAKTSPTQVQTATAEKSTIVSSVSASGNVISSNITSVTTQASGIVKKVYVKEGDKVYSGQKIAEIQLDLEGQQNQAQAYASYLSAKNSLSSAQINYWTLQSAMFAANQKFINDAAARNLTTDDPTYVQENADWLAAEAKFNKNQQSIDQAKSSLNSAWLTYRQTQSVITAPISGKLSSLTIAEGMTLGTQTSSSGTRTGQRVASIVTSGNPLVSVNISEIDVPKIKIGQKATLVFDSLSAQAGVSDKTFSGSVVAIDRVGSTSSNVTSYPAIIKLDTGSDSILANMAVTANIIVEVKNDVVLVPSSAVQNQNGQSIVRVMENNQERSVDVVAGISSDTQTEIISGISEGDEVVTSTTSTTTSEQTRSVFSGGFGGARFIGR